MIQLTEDQLERLVNANMEARASVIKYYATKRLKLLCELGKAPTEVQDEYNSYLKVKKQAERIVIPKFYWVTLNFKEGTVLKDVQHLMSRIEKRKGFDDIKYCYDQRGITSEEKGKGIHIHMILPCKKNIKRNHIPLWLYSTCKDYMGSKSSVDVKEYSNDKLEDKLNYLRGIKFKEDKHECADITKIWRKENNLLDIYTNGSSQQEVSQEKTVSKEEDISKKEENSR